MSGRDERLAHGASLTRISVPQREGQSFTVLCTPEGEAAEGSDAAAPDSGTWRLVDHSGAQLILEDSEGRRVRGTVHVGPRSVWVSTGERTWCFERRREGDAAPAGGEAGGVGAVSSPMTGTVVEVLVQVGDAVAAGDALVVVEAMKMEHRLSAGGAAKVIAVNAKAGDSVDIGQVLVDLEAVEVSAEPESSDG